MTQQKKPVLDPTTQAFLDSINAQHGKPLYELSYPEARQVLESAQQSVPVKKLPVDIEDASLPVGPTGEVSIPHISSNRWQSASAGGHVFSRRRMDPRQQEYA